MYKIEKLKITLTEVFNINAAISMVYDQAPGGKLSYALSKNISALKIFIKDAQEELKKVETKHTTYVFDEKRIFDELEAKKKEGKVTQSQIAEIRESHKSPVVDTVAYEEEKMAYLDGTTETVELRMIPFSAIEEAEKAVGALLTSDGKNIYDEDGTAKTYRLFNVSPRFFTWAEKIITE